MNIQQCCFYVSTTKSVQVFFPFISFQPSQLTGLENILGIISLLPKQVLVHFWQPGRFICFFKYLLVDKFNTEDTLQSAAVEMAQLIITILKKKVFSLISNYSKWNFAFIGRIIVEGTLYQTRLYPRDFPR